MCAANRLLAEEQKARESYLNKVVYRSKVQDEFYDGFCECAPLALAALLHGDA